MVFEIFPVVASGQYAEKNSSPNTLHLGPSPSIIIISKRPLPVSSTKWATECTIRRFMQRKI